MNKRPRIISLSNFIPDEVYDFERFFSFQGSFQIHNYCSYVQNFIGRFLEDKDVAGAVFPASCDSLRRASDLLHRDSKKFWFQLHHPLKISEAGISFLEEEIKRLHRELETFLESSISEKELNERMRLLDQKNDHFQTLYKNLDRIQYSQYFKLLNESFAVPLTEWRPKNPVGFSKAGSTKKIILCGPFLSDLDFPLIVENAGGQIVGDYLTNSYRSIFRDERFFQKHPSSGVFQTIALRILAKASSPTQNSFESIWETLKIEIAVKGAVGVLFLIPKFCEPHEYLFSALADRFERIGVRLLKIQLDNSTRIATLRQKVEMFLDSLP